MSNVTFFALIGASYVIGFIVFVSLANHTEYKDGFEYGFGAFLILVSPISLPLCTAILAASIFGGILVKIARSISPMWGFVENVLGWLYI